MHLQHLKTHQPVRVGTNQKDFFGIAGDKQRYVMELMEVRGVPTGVIKITDTYEKEKPTTYTPIFNAVYWAELIPVTPVDSQ